MIKYGLPYQGSKNGIAEKIVNILPSGGTLYDIFAGGCAISHCAMLRHKFKNYVLNDVNDVPSLFKRAISGEKFGLDWVSREDFFAKKDADPLIRLLWSFGNNAKGYLYSREIEPYKKALHYAVCFNDYTDLAKLCPEVCEYVKENLSKIDIKETLLRRKQIGVFIVQWLKTYGSVEMIQSNPLYKSIKVKHNQPKSLQSLGSLQSLESLESLERLERLQSLERLERLQSLERLDITVKQSDYRKLKFDDTKGVIYCDIPYKNTEGYTKDKFNYEEFYDWCSKQTLPTFISEYWMPEDRFTCIAQFPKRSILSATANNLVIEKLYIPKHQTLDW
jgi:hypothetical protein